MSNPLPRRKPSSLPKTGPAVLLGLLAVAYGCGSAPPGAPPAPGAEEAQEDLSFSQVWIGEGATGTLLPSNGDWKRNDDGTWSIDAAGAFDQACFAPDALSGTYRISVEILHERGGVGGGILFHSRDRKSLEASEMVRFDSASSLLQGRFRDGAFQCDRVIPLDPPIDPSSWTRLELDLDGAAGVFRILVDGKVRAEGCRMLHRYGYPALQASEGRMRFRAFRAEGRASRDPGPVWPVRAWTAEGGALLLRSSTGAFTHRYDPERNRFVLAEKAPAPPPPGDLETSWARRFPALRSMLVEGERVLLALPGRVEIRSLGGRLLGTQRAETIGGLDPVDFVRWRGKTWVVDRRASRLVEVLPAGDPILRPIWRDTDRVEVLLVSGPRVLARRSARAVGPDRIASLSIPSGFDVLPPAEKEREIRLHGPPQEGLLRARRLKILALVYGDVFDGIPPKGPVPPSWPDSAYERVHRELRRTVLWYWMNSRCRLLIDLTIHDIREPVRAADLAENGRPNGKPKEDEIARRAREAGLSLSDIQGVLVLQAYRRRAADTGRTLYVGAGGGLTLGAHGRGYGISWWFVPAKRDYNSWLFCHEFHHQLDALFEISGHPEYLYNHFAPMIGTSGPFGEHWDGNAWILRNWPAWKWDDLRFGDTILCADIDGDGFPDGDPRVPMDEIRFGSDPGKKDSDGDGVPDLEEALFATWIDRSGFETRAGRVFPPDPRSPDSDLDGIEDGEDPLPLLPFDPRLPSGEALRLPPLEDPGLSSPLRISLEFEAGTSPALLIRGSGFEAGDGLRFRALLDLASDGWFTGRDNLEILLPERGPPRIRIQDATVPGRWPHFVEDGDEGFGATAVRTARTFEIRIPCRPERGFPNETGHEFGIDLMFSTAESRKRGRNWSSLFPPHRLVPFRLPSPDEGR